MSIVEKSRKYTGADLLALPDAAQFELVDGELVERAVGVLAGLVEGIIFGKLYAYCEAHNLAHVWPGTTGVRCFPEDPNKVRRPDVSLVRRD